MEYEIKSKTDLEKVFGMALYELHDKKRLYIAFKGYVDGSLKGGLKNSLVGRYDSLLLEAAGLIDASGDVTDFGKEVYDSVRENSD